MSKIEWTVCLQLVRAIFYLEIALFNRTKTNSTLLNQ